MIRPFPGHGNATGILYEKETLFILTHGKEVAMRAKVKLISIPLLCMLMLLVGAMMMTNYSIAGGIKKSYTEMEADLKAYLQNKKHKYPGYKNVWVDIRADPISGESGRIVVHAEDEGGRCQWHFFLKRDYPDYFKPVFVNRIGICTYKNEAFVSDGIGLGDWYTFVVKPHFKGFETSNKDAPLSASVVYQSDRVTLNMRLSEVLMRPLPPKMAPKDRKRIPKAIELTPSK